MARSRDPIRWAARVKGVQEVTLAGEASLDFWRSRLEPLDLEPLERDGRAEVLITSAAARFLGAAFRELSVAVSILPPPFSPLAPRETSAVLLLGAVTSRRLFAWCERTLFAAPYRHGRVTLTPVPPAALSWVDREEEALAASMSRDSDDPQDSQDLRDLHDPRDAPRTPTREGREGWEGAIYLPARPDGPPLEPPGSAPRRLFVARLEGFTRVLPFLGGRDAFRMQPDACRPALQLLAESGFVPREWHLRESAEHAKSRTMVARRGSSA